MEKTIRFIEVDLVRAIHKAQIERYGGLYGLRDEGLLISAVHAPQATFDGHYLCIDLFEMASVYAYSLINNHPFVDGNKRIGMIVAFIFLEINDLTPDVSEEDFYAWGMGLASGVVSQKAFASFLRSSTHGHYSSC